MPDSRSRIEQALKLKMADRPPFSFWAHHHIREQSTEMLAAETVRVVRYFGYDFAKIQNRATCFAEGWGLRTRPPSTYDQPPEVVEVPIRTPSDLSTIKPLDPTLGVLGDQLAVLKMVRAALGTGFPVIQTVFSPAMVLSYLLSADEEQHGPRLQAALQEHPRLTRRALLAIEETYSLFAREAIVAGADGIFYSIKPARPDYLTEDQYAAFCLAADRSILLRAVGGWFNVLHLCGPGAYFGVIKNLPCDAVSFEIGQMNPSLSEVRARYEKAVIGGVSPKPRLLTMSSGQVRDEVIAALNDTSGKGFMLGPGCSIPPATPEDLLLQARHALLAWAHANSAK